jgi:hypothetical protein
MFRKLQRASDILPVWTIQISEFSKNSTTRETFRHLKMWSLGMWWYLVFWNVSKGRRLWNYFDNSNRKVSGHTKFQSSACELPFKCNNAETYIQILLCRTASYVCQEWEHEGVPQASTSWSHCRITPQASIHQTCIMVRKLWNI